MPKMSPDMFSGMRNHLKNLPVEQAAEASDTVIEKGTETSAEESAPVQAVIETAPKETDIPVYTAPPSDFNGEIEPPANGEDAPPLPESSAVPPIEKGQATEKRPVEAVQKRSRNTRTQKNTEPEKKSRGKGVLFYLPEDVHWGLKTYCFNERQTIDAYVQRLHNDARFHTYACAESNCRQQFTLRFSGEAEPVKPKCCPVCGGSRFRSVKTY